MGTRQPLIMPAWCDPESRTYRLSWADILVGLLMVDDERLVFATPSGVRFNAMRSKSSLEWRRGKGFGMIPRFDLSTPQGSFRLYLSRPSTTAPLYREKHPGRGGRATLHSRRLARRPIQQSVPARQ